MLSTSPTFAVPGTVGTIANDGRGPRTAVCKAPKRGASSAMSRSTNVASTARCFAMRVASSSRAGSTSEAENTGALAISGRAATAGAPGASDVSITSVTLVTLSETDCTPIRYVSADVLEPNCRQKSDGVESNCCCPSATENVAAGTNACGRGVLVFPETVTSTLIVCAGLQLSFGTMI